MKKGKLDNETLERLVLGRTGAPRPEVIVGPGIGEDCAVLDFGGYECVVSTDPITASASRVGALAVHIACNDVASNGVEPMAVLLTVLLPPSVTEDEVSEIAQQADEAAKSLGVQIVGGHTEVTDVVVQPLVSATAIGRAPKRGGSGLLRPTRSDGDVHSDGDVRINGDVRIGGDFRNDGDNEVGCGGPAPGDLVVVTKQLALEGTAIAAEQCGDGLRPYLTEEEAAYARAMIGQISVVKEGVIAGRIGVKAMHDVTEGGVLGAVWEVCTRAGAGVQIEAAALPFDSVTLKVCAVLGLDPMRLISSGSMLMVVSEERWGALSAAFAEAGIAATVIGRVKTPAEGLYLVMKDGVREAIEPPGPDEIYRIDDC